MRKTLDSRLRGNDGKQISRDTIECRKKKTMKFPESWLREHVTVAASRDELAARLTAIGLEV